MPGLKHLELTDHAHLGASYRLEILLHLLYFKPRAGSSLRTMASELDYFHVKDDLSSQATSTRQQHHHQRFRDRIDYFHNRFFDGNPDAKMEFTTYKAQRNEQWANSDPAAAQEPPSTPIPPPNRSKELLYAHRDQRRRRKITKRPAEKYGPTSKNHNGTIFGSILKVLKRRNRQRSDLRPGYFDPSRCWPASTQGKGSADELGASATIRATGESASGETEGKVGDELVMNVPAELAESDFSWFRWDDDKETVSSSRTLYITSVDEEKGHLIREQEGCPYLI